MRKLLLGDIDAHCHLADPRIKDVGALLESAHEHGIRNFIMAGVDPADWDLQKQISIEHPGVFCCFGLHPYRVATWSGSRCNQAIEKLEALLPEAIALGELGLDFRERFRGSEAQQVEFFKRQIELAIANNKVMVLHLVHAHGKALEILHEYQGQLVRGGMVHAFNGSAEIAKQYLNLGLYISVGGAVTFSKNKKLQNAVKVIDSNRLILETDSPDQAPMGWPNEINSPSSLIRIADQVADLRKTTREGILRQSRENIKKLFDQELQE